MNLGIIGGADGPSTILLSVSPTDWLCLLAGCVLLILWYTHRRKKKK